MLKYCILITSLLLTACSTMEHRSDTPLKVALPEFTPKVLLQTMWTVNNTGDGINNKDIKLSLAEQQNVLYTADYKGVITAINRNNGKLLWKKDLHLPITAGPTVNENKLILATSDAKVIAINTTNAQIAWQINASSEVLARPQIADNVVYIHSLDGALNALNAQDGRQMWRFAVTIPSLMLRRSSTPVVTTDRVIAGFANGKLVAIKRMDGAVEWTQDAAQPTGRSEIQRMVDISADPVINNNMVYVASYRGNLAAYLIANGHQLWERDISSYAGCSVDNTLLYVAATDGKLWAIEQNSGDTFWVQPVLQGRRLSKPVIIDNYIVVGDEDGYIHCIDKATGKLVARKQFDHKGIEAAPLVIKDTLYILGKSGKLAALRLQDLTT